MIQKGLCNIGIHLPLKCHVYFFTDKISGEAVYDCHCPCGRTWMVADRKKYAVFKVETFANPDNKLDHRTIISSPNVKQLLRKWGNGES